MKNIFIVMSFTFSLSANGQKGEIITDSSKTNAEIFARTLYWIENTWGNSDDMTDIKDKDIGKIQVKRSLKSVPKSGGFAVKGTTITELTILIENRIARLNFEHTIFQWDAGTVWNFEDDSGGAQKQKWKSDVMDEMSELITSYKGDL